MFLIVAMSGASRWPRAGGNRPRSLRQGKRRTGPARIPVPKEGSRLGPRALRTQPDHPALALASVESGSIASVRNDGERQRAEHGNDRGETQSEGNIDRMSDAAGAFDLQFALEFHWQLRADVHRERTPLEQNRSCPRSTPFVAAATDGTPNIRPRRRTRGATSRAAVRSSDSAGFPRGIRRYE
jgi:hypothetical protein